LPPKVVRRSSQDLRQFQSRCQPWMCHRSVRFPWQPHSLDRV